MRSPSASQELCVLRSDNQVWSACAGMQSCVSAVPAAKGLDMHFSEVMDVL